MHNAARYYATGQANQQQTTWQKQGSCSIQAVQFGAAAERTWVGLPLRQGVAIHNDVLRHRDAALLHRMCKQGPTSRAESAVVAMGG